MCLQAVRYIGRTESGEFGLASSILCAVWSTFRRSGMGGDECEELKKLAADVELA